jgi:hypothetical protein
MEHLQCLFTVYGSFGCISLESEIFDDIGSDFWMIFDDEEFHRSSGERK